LKGVCRKNKEKNRGRKQSKKQRKSRGRNIKRMRERKERKGKERYICESEREEKELSFFPREMVETAIF